MEASYEKGQGSEGAITPYMERNGTISNKYREECLRHKHLYGHLLV